MTDLSNVAKLLSGGQWLGSGCIKPKRAWKCDKNFDILQLDSFFYQVFEFLANPRLTIDLGALNFKLNL